MNFRDCCTINIKKYFSVSEAVLKQQCVTASHDILITKIRRNNQPTTFPGIVFIIVIEV